MSISNSEFNHSKDTTTIMEFEWSGENELMVYAEIQWKVNGTDGIGSYDYCGSNYNDEGDTVYEIQYIIFSIYNRDGDKIEPSDELRSQIIGHIINNAEPDFD